MNVSTHFSIFTSIIPNFFHDIIFFHQFFHPLFDLSFVGCLHIEVCIILGHITIFDGSMNFHKLIYFWYYEQMFKMFYFLIALDIFMTFKKKMKRSQIIY
jgi:hypothetical protein